MNVGVIAVALAWGLGLYTRLAAPSSPDSPPLFVTLAGVTLLFSLAEANGTIGPLQPAVHRPGQRARCPVLFFWIAGIVSMLGPGAIASVALVAPMAMAIAPRRLSRS